MSSLCSGPAAEAEVRQAALPPGGGAVSRVWGTGGQAGAQQKPEAFLGQRGVTAAEGAEGREAGTLLLHSNRAEPRAFQQLHTRRKDGGSKARTDSSHALPQSQVRPELLAASNYKLNSHAALASPCSATPQRRYDQGGLIASL